LDNLHAGQNLFTAVELEPLIAKEIEEERRRLISASRRNETGEKIHSSQKNDRKAASVAAKLSKSNRKFSGIAT